MRALVALSLTLSGCLAHRPWLPDQAAVDKCLDSGGCWNFPNNVCERVDPSRCPAPQVQPP